MEALSGLHLASGISLEEMLDSLNNPAGAGLCDLALRQLLNAEKVPIFHDQPTRYRIEHAAA